MENLNYKTPAKTNARGLKPSQEEIKDILFWAGRNLLSLDISSSSPRLRQSFLCEKTILALKVSPPDPIEIDKLDKVLALISLVSDPISRRVLQARCLISPVSFSHLYSWVKISKVLGLSVPTVKARFHRGLDEIKTKISVNDWEEIRK